MEQDKIIEGNKLIAEFMGGKLKEYNLSHLPYYLMPNKQQWMPERLIYHSSWDWQIPVWKKIATLSQKYAVDEENSTRHNKLCDDYESAIFQNNPQLGFEVITQAIQWYKTQPK